MPHDWPGRTRREVNCLFIFTDHKMIRRNRREEGERERERATIKHFSALKNNNNNKMDEGWKFSSIWKLFFRSWVTKKIIVHLNLLKTVFDYSIKHRKQKDSKSCGDVFWIKKYKVWKNYELVRCWHYLTGCFPITKDCNIGKLSGQTQDEKICMLDTGLY